MSLRASRKYLFFYKDEILIGEYLPIPNSWGCSRRLLRCSQAGSEPWFLVDPDDIFETLDAAAERVKERQRYWQNKAIEIKSAIRLKQELEE